MSKKIIKLTESDLIRLVKRVIKEQDDNDNELLQKLHYFSGSYQPISFFSDANQKNIFDATHFEKVVKQPDGSVWLYPAQMERSGYKVLVFKCGIKGLYSKGTGKTLYSKNVENVLKNEMCK